MIWIRTAVALWLVASASTLVAADPGQLCFTSKSSTLPDCRATANLRIEIAPAAVARTFTWTAGDRSRLAIGVIRPGEAKIDLSASSWRTFAISIEATDHDRWPQTVTLSAREGSQSAEATVDPSSLRFLRRISVSADAQSLQFSAPHHKNVAWQALDSKRDIRVMFVAFPEISGVVIDAKTRQGIAGAGIEASGNMITSTNASGRFVAEISGQWPKQVEISDPAHARQVLQLPPAAADFDAGTLPMSSGGSIHLTVDSDTAISVQLLQREGRQFVSVARQKITEHTANLEAVEAGHYTLLVEGDGPLQRDAVPVTVKGAAVEEKAISIKPATFTLRVRAGQKPVPATVVFSPASSEWQATVTTDADGMYHGVIWQEGEYAAFVQSDSPPADLATHRSLSGSDIEWDIDIPNRTIAGSLTDQGGSPIPNATVTLDSESVESGSQRSTTSAADGHFEFNSVEAGKQTVGAHADGFLPGISSFMLTEDTAQRSVTLVLERGVMQSLLVLDSIGQPSANAVVVDESGVDNAQLTDATGRTLLPLHAGERKAVFVFPAEGSFAAIDLAVQAESAPKEIEIRVPAGVATIAISSGTGDGNVLPAVLFAIRHDGRFIPAPVRVAASLRRGLPLRTGQDGVATLRNMPAGLYELWPYFTPEQYSVIASGQAAAPVRLGATAGVNTVRLTFSH